MGQTHVVAGAKSPTHHHGESETAIYVVSGTPAFVFADGDHECDWRRSRAITSSVPPYVPHREENPRRHRGPWSSSRAAPEAIVVNLPSLWPVGQPDPGRITARGRPARPAASAPASPRRLFRPLRHSPFRPVMAQARVR